jgi:hypothetical protein
MGSVDQGVLVGSSGSCSTVLCYNRRRRYFGGDSIYSTLYVSIGLISLGLLLIIGFKILRFLVATALDSISARIEQTEVQQPSSPKVCINLLDVTGFAERRRYLFASAAGFLVFLILVFILAISKVNISIWKAPFFADVSVLIFVAGVWWCSETAPQNDNDYPMLVQA